MKIVKKNDSLLMKVIHYFLMVITFGKNKNFLSSFVTTIGQTIYVPDSWDRHSESEKEMILAHEQVHIDQYKKEGILFSLKYLFWPFPCIRATARLKYECEAFAKDIVLSYKKNLTPVFSGRFDYVVQLLSGPEYFWTCTDQNYVRKVLTFCILKELKKQRNAGII